MPVLFEFLAADPGFVSIEKLLEHLRKIDPKYAQEPLTQTKPGLKAAPP
jgi:hypothetical protein